jgi:hypothetical protein
MFDENYALSSLNNAKCHAANYAHAIFWLKSFITHVDLLSFI